MSTDVSPSPGLVRCRCLFCGNTFWSKRMTATYCSPSHKQKMHRWRTKLDNQIEKACKTVQEIGSYLTYDNSTSDAVRGINVIISECFRVMDAHNVKRVK